MPRSQAHLCRRVLTERVGGRPTTDPSRHQEGTRTLIVRGVTDQPGTTPPASATASQRAALIGRLAAELALLTTVGDVEGARVLNEAIGRLLL